MPGPLGRGELDGSLRGAILARLPRTAFLPPALPRTKDDADGLPETLRPREAEVVEGAETVQVLAEVLPSLLPAGLERRVELRTLEVARVPLTEAVDRLAGLEKEPGWWRRLYDSLAGVDPDRLTGLPVPLAGGRTTIGPRQVLLPMPDATPGETLARLGLKVAHVDAAHPLLEKLGALPATPRAVLTTPQVRAAVAGSLDDDAWSLDDDGPVGVDELAELVLTLVRDANLEPGDEPWLGALALPDDEGELAPAGELLLPGSPFAQVVREGELAMVDGDLAERWGNSPSPRAASSPGSPWSAPPTWSSTRTNSTRATATSRSRTTRDCSTPSTCGARTYSTGCPTPPCRPSPPNSSPCATSTSSTTTAGPRPSPCSPARRCATPSPSPYGSCCPTARTRSSARTRPGGCATTPSSTAAYHGLRAAGGDPLLAGLYDPADATGFEDEQVLRALGVRTSVAALLDEPGGAAELLDRLADPEREVGAAQLHGLYGALADLDPEQVTLPDELRAVVDGEVRVVDAADAVVADAPDLLPLAGGLALLPVSPGRAADLADLFQVRRLSATADAEVTQEGAEHPVPESVRTLLGPATPQTYVEHEELFVAGVEVDWRRTSDGTVHASTLEGVAAGLAWAAGQWPRRFEVAALLEDPSRTAELARDRWFD